MLRNGIPIFAAAAVVLVARVCAAGGANTETVDFNRDVLPILASRCFECHGPDTSTRKADLRLDVREVAVAERDGIAAILPGRPDASALVVRISTNNPDDLMPPAKKGPRLTLAQVKVLRDWVAQGAPYAEHWAFVRPVRTATPEVNDRNWGRGEIDRFVLHRLEQEGLKPAAAASRQTLIRRATLDLLGLPPTPAEVEAFVRDNAPDAYEKLVDRLLASPHYGERYGRHWLDVARYADSGGFETDIFFGHAWRYRDYVIRSLNADKPFDRFVREQIGGDELFPGDAEARLGTAMYTVGPVLQEAGMVKGKLEYDQLTDFTDTTGSAFLGLTLGCARCHDHKYDPVTQKDYFGLQAVFAASDQFEFTPDGTTKLRARAALKNTQKEFELDQALDRARRAGDPKQREQYVRLVGDYFIAADEELSRRVQLTKNHQALAMAARRYSDALAGALEPPAPVAAGANASDDADNDDDDDNDAADATPAAAAPTGGASKEDLLAEVGRAALQLGGRRNPARRAFRDLQTEPERRAFLLALGSQNIEPKKPEGYVDDIDQLRLDIGTKHLSDASRIPLRVLDHLDKPLETRLLKRGELEMPGEVVAPALPAKLAGGVTIPADVAPNRRRAALAEWIASPRNPLTARVIVNRVWHWHFGQGLVRTPGDFGVAGERPTHPELLDFLAVEFMNDGWSLKRLHRRVMLSATYRMSAITDEQTVARDPDNRLLTRFQPRRLEAEAVWDGLRAVAGTLRLDMYGLPVAPPLDGQEQIGNFRKWPVSTPDEANRRAIYILVKRSFRFPMLSAFDLPDNISSCGRRDVTTVPNQALTLLNNRTMQEQAAAFAERLSRETDGKPENVAAKAWMYAYGRSISDDERAQAVEFLKAHPAVELCLALFNTNEFIYLQ